MAHLRMRDVLLYSLVVLIAGCANAGGPSTAAPSTSAPSPTSSVPQSTPSNAPATSPAAASPTAPAVPGDWKRFESNRNGYALMVPPDWVLTDATSVWAPGTEPAFGDPVWDRLAPPSGTPQLLVASQPVAAGQDATDWICRRLDPLVGSGACSIDADQPIAFGHVGGRYRQISEGFAAAAVAGGRGYLVVELTQKNSTSLLQFTTILGSFEFEPVKAVK